VRCISLAVLALTLAFGGCGGDDAKPDPVVPAPPPKLNHGNPRALAMSIFAIAKHGNLDALAGVADPPGADGDAKSVATVATAPAAQQAEFKSAFATGKVTGEKVEGDKASVDITFGPEGKKTETLKMVLREKRWYLQGL
jgi:hypothetical protein